MMALVNTFLCQCGRVIGRPKDEPYNGNGWGVVPWHAQPGQAKLHGIKCAKCRLNWLFLPSMTGKYAEVRPCCDDHRCECRFQEEE